MRATAEVRAEPDGRGGVRMTVLRSQAPLLLRRTPDAVHLVGGAAGPLGGDDLHLSIRVCSGARLRMRSVAAALAQPDAAGRPSDLTVVVHVEAGATLDWCPEPLVSTVGSHHRVHTEIHVAGDASVRWRDVTVLGRHAEIGGLVEQDLTVTQDGAEVLCQEHAWGPGAPGGWAGPAVLGGARVVAAELAVRSGSPMLSPSAGAALSVLRFAAGCELATGLGADVPSVLRSLAAVRADLPDPTTRTAA